MISGNTRNAEDILLAVTHYSNNSLPLSYIDLEKMRKCLDKRSNPIINFLESPETQNWVHYNEFSVIEARKQWKKAIKRNELITKKCDVQTLIDFDQSFGLFSIAKKKETKIKKLWSKWFPEQEYKKFIPFHVVLNYCYCNEK